MKPSFIKANHFISITSSGGYIGRLWWTNTGIDPDWPHWGDTGLIPDTILGAWAGSVWCVRAIINRTFVP